MILDLYWSCKANNSLKYTSCCFNFTDNSHNLLFKLAHFPIWLCKEILDLRNFIRKHVEHVLSLFRGQPNARNNQELDKTAQDARYNIENVMATVNQSRDTNRNAPGPDQGRGNDLEEGCIKDRVDLREDGSYQDAARCMTRRETVLIRSNWCEVISLLCGWPPPPGKGLQRSNNDNIQ